MSRFEQVGGVPVLSLVSPLERPAARILKRVIDVIGSLIALVVLAPLLAAAMAAIKIADGGPVLFRQVRVGRHGRHFDMWKLRSMDVGAEDRLETVLHLNERDGVTFKAAADPRVTRVGRWLRRTSIDEIPQLVNVLRGDMSLVGPRPGLPREVLAYEFGHRRRLSVKPGITGLWQISGRADADFDSWVEKDLRYIDGWTPWSDLRIIALTIPALIRHRGV